MFDEKEEALIRKGVRLIMQHMPESNLREIMEGFTITIGKNLNNDQLAEAFKIISEEYNLIFN